LVVLKVWLSFTRDQTLKLRRRGQQFCEYRLGLAGQYT